jgi:hypothetical protein
VGRGGRSQVGLRSGERGDEFVDQPVVERLAGGQQSVPDDAEDDVGDGARRQARREVAAGLGTVQDDPECVAAALQEQDAKPLAERGVDLGLYAPRGS